jgi:hypothetical protein
MDDGLVPCEECFVQGRKRVIAREVEQITDANRQSAALTPEVITPELLAHATFHADEAPIVVDPSTLGRRHRRSSHQRIYRWTQGCSMLGAGLAAVGIVCTAFDDSLLGRWLAIPGLALGVISILLSSLTSLSARWRGWAIAATVFAAVSLGLTWLQPELSRDDPSDLVAPKPAKPVPQSNM